MKLVLTESDRSVRLEQGKLLYYVSFLIVTFEYGRAIKVEMERESREVRENQFREYESVNGIELRITQVDQ
jgi:hypothetical protein